MFYQNKKKNLSSNYSFISCGCYDNLEQIMYEKSVIRKCHFHSSKVICIFRRATGEHEDI